jgi:hypothetical protein
MYVVLVRLKGDVIFRRVDTLKMEAACSSETLALISQVAQCNIPEDRNRHLQREWRRAGGTPTLCLRSRYLKWSKPLY